MKFILTSLVFLVFLTGCGNGKKSQSATNDALPECVRNKVAELEKKSVSNPPVQIDEYQYQGKKVFLYRADCCDQFNVLYDEACKSICAPSGGLTGRGDGRCKDFDSLAKHVRLVWKTPGK